MLTIRRDKEIHREEGGWFTARWHFSFGPYRDPAYDAFATRTRSGAHQCPCRPGRCSA
jgi:redox-sensitive bicupin YhaK (pirin superfamily)